MNVSQARLEANRRNAERSTGPRTEAGERSRANASHQGLTAKVVRTGEKIEAVSASASPTSATVVDPIKAWLAEEVVVLTQRIDLAHQAEERERDRASLRAQTCWDEDRLRDADQIGRGLAKRPDRTVRRLRSFAQGCTWMIQRWEWLLEVSRSKGEWTEAQKTLSYDLRGMPELYRNVVVDPGAQAGLATREIEALRDHRAKLEACDTFDRESARLKLTDQASPELRRLIRYELALHRRLRWCIEQIQGVPTRPTRTVEPPTPKQPRPRTKPQPRPVQAPTMMEPDDFDLDEDFSDLDALFCGDLPPLHPMTMAMREAMTRPPTP